LEDEKKIVSGEDYEFYVSKIVHSLQGENACKCCWALNLLKQNDIPIPFKNCKTAQVGYNSERSLRDDMKHMPSKHSLLGEPNLWTKGSGC
jgi:hypothetical protein